MIMKKFTLYLPPDVSSFLQHLHPGLKTKIRRALEEIQQDPFIGKPLKEPLQGFWSYRVSHYRVIYEIKSREIRVEVVDIDERKIIYEKVAHLLS